MKRFEWPGFAMLCLLSGSEWLVEYASPSELPGTVRQSLHYAVIGLVALVLYLVAPRRSRSGRQPVRSWLELAGASVMLLGMPALLSELSRGMAVASSGTALFALAPVFIAVGAASFTAENRGRELMMPALVGGAGALFVLPFRFPANLHEGLIFAAIFAAVLLAVVGNLWMHRALGGFGLAPAVAILCGANAVLFGLASVGPGAIMPIWSGLLIELARCFVIELPQIFLLVWLLREVRPERLAARYLVAPLLAVVEGMFLFRSVLTVRMGLGILLMVAGGGALLLWSGSDESGEPPQLKLS
jgi:drug/metabolite transporter (DMT)-like permease